MLTKAQVATLQPGALLYHTKLRDKDGHPVTAQYVRAVVCHAKDGFTLLARRLVTRQEFFIGHTTASLWTTKEPAK